MVTGAALALVQVMVSNWASMLAWMVWGLEGAAVAVGCATGAGVAGGGGGGGFGGEGAAEVAGAVGLGDEVGVFSCGGRG